MFKSMITALAMMFAFQASAEEARIGDWTVHYSAFPSTFISPEVAQSNNLERSRYNGLLNIAVLDADGKSVQVALRGQGKNLLGNVRQLEFQTIREGDSIYYIAQYPYRNEDNVLFTIDISSPTQGGELSFRHTFYTE